MLHFFYNTFYIFLRCFTVFSTAASVFCNASGCRMCLDGKISQQQSRRQHHSSKVKSMRSRTHIALEFILQLIFSSLRLQERRQHIAKNLALITRKAPH